MTTGSDAARIHASGTQGETGAGLLARLAKLEVDHDKLAQDYARVMNLPRDHEGDWHGCEEEGARWTQVDPLTGADIEAAASELAATAPWGGEGCCKAAYASEGNVHDHPVAGNARRDDQ